MPSEGLEESHGSGTGYGFFQGSLWPRRRMGELSFTQLERAAATPILESVIQGAAGVGLMPGQFT
jgi:hypothetical protein